MKRKLKINNLFVNVDDSPYIKSFVDLVEEENLLMVWCPVNTTEEDVVQHIYENHRDMLLLDEDGSITVKDVIEDPVENHEEVADEEKHHPYDPLMMSIIDALQIKRSPFVNKIRFSYDSSKKMFFLRCPMDIDEVSLYRYLNQHRVEIARKLHLVEDKHPSKPLLRKQQRVVMPAPVAPIETAPKEQKRQKNDEIFVVEGYQVIRQLEGGSLGSISAKIVQKNKIIVRVSKPYYNNIPLIRNYVEEKLNSLIREYVASISKSHFHSDKRVIEKGSFSYTNRRSDITDEEPLKVSKHKLKTFVTSPTKTQGYVGETQRNVIGMCAIGPDGRFVPFQRGEDYGLKDRND